ncbi:DNA alkylation repair protein [Candidatus Saccharibacteria bacterium]|nr:DNA alkylation repair protein [Candidatus Saccharibacteria bacterium]
MEKITNYIELKRLLEQSADDKCRDFTMKICSTGHPVLGVKVPRIRECAKKVPSEKINEFIAAHPSAYEEVLLRGFLIARLSYEEMLKEFDTQIKYIDDWSTCDLFCSAVGKLVRKNKEDFLERKIKKLLSCKKEFTTRVGLVLLKCCYVETDYLKFIFDTTDKLSSSEEYYVKMGLAWLISECFVKFPTATMEYLLRSKLPKWTLNKTISKICDSYRVDKETKKLLRAIKK